VLVTEEEKALSVNQAARRLGVHPNTVRTAIEQGRIRATKVLGRWRISEREVQRILRGGLDSSDEEQ
jgi:excisionase family DNA binding protein